MYSTAILGCAWGDEAKAKIVDVLAKDADYVVRFQGGNNAGHTIKLKDKKVNIKFSDELFHIRYALNDSEDKSLCGCVLVVKEYDVPVNLRNAVFSRNISYVKGLKNHFEYFWQKSNH